MNYGVVLEPVHLKVCAACVSLDLCTCSKAEQDSNAVTLMYMFLWAPSSSMMSTGATACWSDICSWTCI